MELFEWYIVRFWEVWFKLGRYGFLLFKGVRFRLVYRCFLVVSHPIYPFSMICLIVVGKQYIQCIIISCWSMVIQGISEFLMLFFVLGSWFDGIFAQSQHGKLKSPPINYCNGICDHTAPNKYDQNLLVCHKYHMDTQCCLHVGDLGLGLRQLMISTSCVVCHYIASYFFYTCLKIVLCLYYYI